jgi:hypothetical protein
VGAAVVSELRGLRDLVVKPEFVQACGTRGNFSDFGGTFVTLYKAQGSALHITTQDFVGQGFDVWRGRVGDLAGAPADFLGDVRWCRDDVCEKDVPVPKTCVVCLDEGLSGHSGRGPSECEVHGQLGVRKASVQCCLVADAAWRRYAVDVVELAKQGCKQDMSLDSLLVYVQGMPALPDDVRALAASQLVGWFMCAYRGLFRERFVEERVRGAVDSAGERSSVEFVLAAGRGEASSFSVKLEDTSGSVSEGLSGVGSGFATVQTAGRQGLEHGTQSAVGRYGRVSGDGVSAPRVVSGEDDIVGAMGRLAVASVPGPQVSTVAVDPSIARYEQELRDLRSAALTVGSGKSDVEELRSKVRVLRTRVEQLDEPGDLPDGVQALLRDLGKKFRGVASTRRR